MTDFIPLKPYRAFPSLPAVGGDLVSHSTTLREIKEGIEQHERRRGDPLDSFVRLRELIDVNVLQQLGDRVVKFDDTVFGGSVETEFVQDTIGNILVNTAEIAFTYNDSTPSISALIVAVPDAKLSANVALLDRDEQEWTGDNRYIASTADQLTVGDIGTDGYIALSRGTGLTAPGYARFYDAAGVARGYVGFHDSATRITLTSENAWGIRIDSVTDIRVDATTVNRLIAPQLQIAQSENLPSLLMNGGTTPGLIAGGSGAGDSFWIVQRYNNASGGPDIAMYHSRGASIGTHTILQQNDEIGSISFYASDGTNLPVKVARIIGFINGVVSGATDLPSRIAILTTPDGSAVSQTTAFFSPEEIELNTTMVDLNGSMDVSLVLTVQGATGLGTVGIASGGDITVSKASASLYLNDSAAAANEDVFRIANITGDFMIQTRTDANGAGVTLMLVERTSTVVDRIQFNGTELEFNGTTLDINSAADISGALNIGGTLSTVAINATGGLTITNTVPAVRFVETGVTADNTTWGWAANGEILQGVLYSDDLASTVSFMFVNRTLNVADQVRFDATEFEVNATTIDINGAVDISSTLLVGGTTTSVGTLAVDSASQGIIRILSASNNPFFQISNESQAADNRNWLMISSNLTFSIRPYNDALAVSSTSFSITRSGTDTTRVDLAATEIQFDSTTLDFNGTADFSGSVGVGIVPVRALHVAATAAWLRLDETDAGVNEKVWLIGQSGGGAAAGLQILSRTDADGAGAQAVQILRSGTAITEIQLDATLLDFNGNLDVSGTAVIGSTLGVAGRITAGTNGGQSEILRLVGNDTLGDCYVSFFEDDNATRKGYLGYGNVGDDAFYIANEENASVLIQTSATTRFTVAGTGAVSFAVSAPVTINSTLAVVGALTMSSNITISRTDPRFYLDDTDAGAGLRQFYIRTNAGQLEFASANDAGSGVENAIIIAKNTSSEITSISLLGDAVGIAGATFLSGSTTPAALGAGDNDDVNLGVGTVVRARIAGNAAGSNLTGVTGGADGKLLILTNISANEIMIINEDAGSTAANRFAINGDMALPQNCSAIFIYDDNIDRWTRLN